MIIDRKNNFVFVHVPKTGGTAFRTFIEYYKIFNKDNTAVLNLNPCHITILNAYKNYPELKNELDQFYKFGFVRNPYSRFLSAFLHATKTVFKYDKKKFEDLGVDGLQKYLKEEYIKKYFVQGEKFYEILKVPQYRFLCDANDNILVNKVCRFENYKNEIIDVLNFLNMNVDNSIKVNGIQRKNENYTFSFDKELILDSEIKDTIYNYYKKDFDIFGYEK